jgi:hypothetical protein
MLARDDVQQRLHQLRKLVQADSLLSIHEKRRFLKKVVMTPVAEVDETDPLCGRVTRSTRTTCGAILEKVTVQIPDKLRALELDAKLAGELVGGVAAAIEDGRPLQTEDETRDRLAHVMELMVRFSGGRAFRPDLTHPLRAESDVPKRVGDSRLEELSLVLARRMAGKLLRPVMA